MFRGRWFSGSAVSLAAIAIAVSSSACVVETRVGTGAATGGTNANAGSGGGGTTYTLGGAPSHAGNPTSTFPTPSPSPSPSGPRKVSIRHPTPTGHVVTTPVPVARDGGVFGGNDANGALKGLVYFIPQDTMQMPDVSTMTPQALVYTNQLQIATRDYEDGIAGTNRKEFYAIQYTGHFSVSKPGTYNFALDSTDGSLLYIDGRLVVNNDQRHTPKKAWGTIDLTPGVHSIRVDYFKAYRWTVELVLDVIPPGGTEIPWSARM